MVLVNFRGAADTVTALQHLAALDTPAERLEVVVVDNTPLPPQEVGEGRAAGAEVGVLSEAAEASPLPVRVVAAPRNLGFAGGCNLGVAHATGAVVAFLNNDARPDPQWVEAATAVLDHEPRVAAVASRVLDWDGERVDFVDASLTWYGMGYKREAGQRAADVPGRARDVLFGTGSAMFVRTALFREVGGFDERFFMFYEDVDLGWRLNLLGHRVRHVPGSVAYHRHHASMTSFGPWREHFLLERNALLTLYKNYGDEALARVLPAALALAVRRGTARGDVDPGVLDLEELAERGGLPPDEHEPMAAVHKDTLASVLAVDAFAGAFPGLARDREALQAVRRRSDAELLPLFRQALEPAFPLPRYLEAHDALVEAFGVVDAFATRRKVVVCTAEPLTAKMAGPAIRAWQIARALAEEHDVRLVTLRECTLSSPDFVCESVSGRDLHRLERWCDVFLFQGLVMAAHSWLAESDKIIVCDVYDPFHLEQLEQAKDLGETARRQVVRDCTQALNDQLTRGDFFLCASGKQRDFWLGQLAAVGRLNVDTYDDDESMDSLIAVAPFGTGDAPPERRRPAIRGVVPGIGPDDDVVLWGGGIYNWFDPLTLIRAVDAVRAVRPSVRLFFLGVKHPNPDVPEMRVAVAARDLSDRLGLTGTHVFFNADWVAYEERADYLLEADVGVSTHLPHVETEFSFRTRMLDYLWAGLPVVCTAGDGFAELLSRAGAGVAVPAQDVEALAAALLSVLEDPDGRAEMGRAAAAMAPQFTWSRALEPLVAFVREPRRAADRAARMGVATVSAAPVYTGYTPSVRGDLGLVRTYWRDGGAGEVVRRARGRVRRVVAERLPV